MEQPNPQVQPGIRPPSFSITSTTVTDHMNFTQTLVDCSMQEILLQATADTNYFLDEISMCPMLLEWNNQ
uniref:Uncharacterized protein n=1 Tax=Arundo donax TaxID=35708 RepID=A0A0A9DQU7_ARUDO